MHALRIAGSVVFEPGYAVEVEVPGDSVSGVVGFLTVLGADIGPAEESGSAWVVPAQIPARSLRELAGALPGLTRGEGTMWYEPGLDRRVRGTAPTRERSDGNPRPRLDQRPPPIRRVRCSFPGPPYG